jgi:RHS repeat-associated protein
VTLFTVLDYYYVFNSQLSSISSDLFGDAQSIIESISYDGRGNIDQMIYGNGTVTNYKYADRTWNLMGSMVIGKPSGGSTAVPLLDRTYSYNSLGVIGSINRVMDQSLVQPGETDHTFSFSYDAYNRLLQGGLDISGVGPSYDVSTSFNDAGGITSKMSNVSQGSQTLAANAAEMTYDLSYNYNASKPHQLDVVVDQISGNSQHFTYNGSGSIKQIQDNSQTQDFYWNEEQWLNAVQNDKGIHHYIYDHTGERIMKSSVIQTNVYVNDQIVGTIQELEPYTLYVNPYFVITEFSNADKVSKHYYMGSQRVASELAVQTTSYSPRIAELENQSSSIPSDPWLNNLNEALSDFGVAPLLLEVVNKELPTIESIYPDLSPHTSYKTSSTQRVFYWYHPDYIGNVDLVTDLSGEAYELFLYNPWGENLYEWNSGTSTWTSPYRFNGKELDQETGFHYYGARYSNPFISMWLSVDPKTHWYNSKSPYLLILGNPINLIDPNGEWIKGAGLFRNIFNSDERILAENLASKHVGAEINRFHDGYQVSYSIDDGYAASIEKPGKLSTQEVVFFSSLVERDSDGNIIIGNSSASNATIKSSTTEFSDSSIDFVSNTARGMVNSPMIALGCFFTPLVSNIHNSFVEDYQNKWSAQPWYFEEDWRLEHLPTGKEGYKMAMKATFNTILLGLPAAEGATLIEKISLIGSKTVTKNGAGKMIDKIN